MHSEFGLLIINRDYISVLISVHVLICHHIQAGTTCGLSQTHLHFIKTYISTVTHIGVTLRWLFPEKLLIEVLEAPAVKSDGTVN